MARGRRWLGLGLLAGLAPLVAAGPAAANTTPQALPFTQSWTNTGLITAADNWDAVPGIVGYRGDGLTTTTAVDPQTVVSEGTPVVDVIQNQATTNGVTAGGVGEFELADPVVAFQGSGTADAPNLVLYLDTTGLTTISVAYTLRDIDGTDNAVQPVAVQYRAGTSGSFTNVPAGFVADATTGAGTDQPVTPVAVTLPAAANDQPNLQVRVLTTDAVGSDEWVGIDDIAVTAGADTAPAVQSTTPADGATGVAADASPTVTFTEPVDLAAGAFAITCATSGAHTPTVSGGPTTFTLDPAVDLTTGETCTVAITGTAVTDQDLLDPPDAMAADDAFSFTVAAPPVTADVVISEVYGGGGNANAPFTNDFVELLNREGTPVDLSGWSIQYASATGSTWSVTPLSDTVPAGRNYLVQEGGGVNGVPLPTPDATGGILMSATNGKVALVSSTTALSGACPTDPAIVDLVGYGPTASCSETAPTPVLSNTTAALRKGNGTVDTDDNSADFDVAAPDPHASADPDPAVQSTTPANGAAGVAPDANVTVAFSEPVDVAGDAITIICAASGAHAAVRSGGPTSFTLDPDADFAAGEQCTVAVAAAGVTDQDAEDPPDAMAADFGATFTIAETVACGEPATGIHAVQGGGAASPIAGQTVTVEGVVVGDYQGAGEFGGFYVQEEAADADADAATSEGLFAFSTAVDVAPGDTVRVTGQVLEFGGLTELSPVTGLQVCASGATIAPTAFSLPFGTAADEEALEGMLVTLDQTLTATEVFNLGRFGEVSLSGVGRLYTPTAVATPGAAAQAQLAANARSRIVLDDGVNLQNLDPTRYPQGGLSASNTLRVGDTLPALTGVMDFRFSAYRIQPIGPLTWSHDNARTPAPEPVGGNLKVASFNVLNYFNGDGLGGGFPTPRGANTPEEFARQRAKIVSAITALDGDIVGLMEIENDAPPNSALEDLVAGLNASAGAGTYAFVDTGVVGTDEIKVALIYKPASVSPVGPFATITSAVDPRFVDTLNRPSLAQTFQRADGARLTVVVHHLKSKGSDCNAVGDPDTGDGQGNCNVTRTNAAAALVDWLATDPTGSGDPDVLLIGDMNSYTFEDPITTFVDGGFVNLVRQFGGLTPYSYVFNGESGYLDHALASPSLAAQATGTADWHINPDEPTVLDYNVEFKTPNQVTTFYDPGPYRASDHDPVVIGLDLAGAPGVDAGGPYAVGEGGAVDVSASGSGGTSYAWDLDGDGTFETTGQTATFSAAALDGPATRTIAVRLSGPGGTATDEATVEVANVAPTVAAAGPATAVIGAATTWRFTTTDPAPADQAGAGFTLRIDWGDGTPVQVVTGASPQDVAHTYATAGDRAISVTATDDDGGTSAAATAAVTAFGAVLQPDVCTPGRQALVIVGTGAADQIALRPASGGRVEVRFGGASVGTFPPTGQLVVSGLGGGDAITIDAALARQATIYGGAGGDTLQTGSGSATLVGGAGADTLASGAGRDVLIGGGDGDTLGGGNGDDVLVAGTTSHDAETPAGQRALCAIAAEWTRTSMPYVLRIAHLTGLLPGGLNGSAVLRPSGAGRTVFDDGAVDRLTGGNADDWFLLNVAGAGARDTSDRRLLEIALDT